MRYVDYTNCLYRVHSPDDRQQVCSKHVEAYYWNKLIENSSSCWFMLYGNTCVSAWWWPGMIETFSWLEQNTYWFKLNILFVFYWICYMAWIVEEQSEDGLRENWRWGVEWRPFLWRDSWSLVWKVLTQKYQRVSLYSVEHSTLEQEFFM
jgi:hypothetical protein